MTIFANIARTEKQNVKSVRRRYRNLGWSREDYKTWTVTKAREILKRKIRKGGK